MFEKIKLTVYKEIQFLVKISCEGTFQISRLWVTLKTFAISCWVRFSLKALNIQDEKLLFSLYLYFGVRLGYWWTQLAQDFGEVYSGIGLQLIQQLTI